MPESTTADMSVPFAPATGVPANRRKFSFPATLHSANLLGDTSASTSTLFTRRRLSNVSDAVTRKLSSTIGWRSPIPTQDIITQGKCLCGQYVRLRLRRAGVFSKKFGLQRIRSIVGTPSVHVVRQVFPALNCVGDELERLHPRLFTGVARQIYGSQTSDLRSPETTTVLLSAVARDLFKLEITWAKIIALFSITSGLAIDCVRQGHAEYLPKLLDGCADVIEDELVPWINENGGWIGLHEHVHPESTKLSALEWMIVAFGCIVIFLMIVIVVRFVGNFLTELLRKY